MEIGNSYILKHQSTPDIHVKFVKEQTYPATGMPPEYYFTLHREEDIEQYKDIIKTAVISDEEREEFGDNVFYLPSLLVHKIFDIIPLDDQPSNIEARIAELKKMENDTDNFDKFTAVLDLIESDPDFTKELKPQVATIVENRINALQKRKEYLNNLK